MTKPRHDIPASTLDKQRRASDPGVSAWVAANAGSGKTYVLTRRVIRLLLAGAEPGRILCLTFTKAAAANMALKVFETLSAWVTLDDAALGAEVAATGAGTLPPDRLAEARRLFARAVETPGGLKILTIHAFCEKLLHRFPFEANVPAAFAVADERREANLRARAQERVLDEALGTPGTPLAEAVRTLGTALRPDAFAALLREAMRHREVLEAVADAPAALLARLGELLGSGAHTADLVDARMLAEAPPVATWLRWGNALKGGSRNGKHAAGDSLLAAAAAPEGGRLQAYLDVFFTGAGEPRKRLVADSLRATQPTISAALDDEQARLVTLVALRRDALAAERTAALLIVAAAAAERYAAVKRAAGLLDFADLVERAGELLTRSDSAWVLFKLDQGVDHILVDEAQDTSPAQWAILDALSRDFFAGAGAGRGDRTLFAVGDEKQSIYSFQGARPAMLRDVHAALERRARDARKGFETVDLLLSFRSAAPVLALVDRVFAHERNARGLTASGVAPPPHEALKRLLPGLVELWPKVEGASPPDPADWRLPVDTLSAGNPAAIVAGRVARHIARLVAPNSQETVEGDRGRRPIRPGDVLVLVRTRNSFFDAVIRALKEARVPVAGADRLVLTDHIATLDLMAAGRCALLPEDDLTLACVLKSPLIGLDDDDLIRLAPERPGSLAAALDAAPEERYRAAATTLAVWRDWAATLTPFGFYTRLLGQGGGRRAMLGRLGPEAADVMDEFVALALAHERDGPPSLLTFLDRLGRAEAVIKRDLAQPGDAVRVMTVHAAKGLEAKVVFLPDTCGAPLRGQHEPNLFPVEGELLWSGKVADDPPAVGPVRQAAFDAVMDEYRRLLYVALTRAEERLYIAGFHGVRPPPTECWYDMIVASGLRDELEKAPAPWDADETVLRSKGFAPGAAAIAAPPATEVMPPLPDWIGRPVPPETGESAPPIRPSSALGAADRPDRPATDAPRFGDRARAALAGRLTHRLLQHLPGVEPSRRLAAAARFLDRHGAALEPAERTTVAESVVATIEAPHLAPLFGPGSRAEVGVAATVMRPGHPPLPVNGQIDRLAEAGEEVWLAEFKSGRPRPLADTPPSYLAQLALYRAAVAPLYPGRNLRAVLVWTEGSSAVEPDAEALTAALAALP